MAHLISPTGERAEVFEAMEDLFRRNGWTDDITGPDAPDPSGGDVAGAEPGPTEA